MSAKLCNFPCLEELKAQALALHALMDEEVQHAHWLQLSISGLVDDEELLAPSLQAAQHLQAANGACVSLEWSRARLNAGCGGRTYQEESGSLRQARYKVCGLACSRE